MADTKISALTAGAPALTTDMLPARRAAGNVSLLVSDLTGIGAPIASGTANSILYVGATGTLTQDNTNFTWNRDSVAGKGLYFNAGTAASAVSALSITQTWNYNTAALDGVLWTFTDTSSHASTNAFRILGGAAGATLLHSIGKVGEFVFGSTMVGGFFGTINAGSTAAALALTSSSTTGTRLDLINSSSGGKTLSIFTIGSAASPVPVGTMFIQNGTDSVTMATLSPIGAMRFGGGSALTDVAPTTSIVKSPNAYAQAATNTAGADLIIGPGIGRRFATVVDYSLLDAGVDTITIVVNGTATVGTADAATQDGTHWVIGATNDATATNIATWMSTISGVTGAAVGASAYATPASTTHTLTIATNADAGEMTVTSGADGLPYLGAAANGAAAGAGTLTNAPQAGDPSVYVKAKVIIGGTLTTVAIPAWTVP